MVDQMELLITGGTGSLGKAVLKNLIQDPPTNLKGIRVYSRDELKQSELRKWLSANNPTKVPVALLIGDVRDKDRLKLAVKGATHIIHAAALKQVPSCEENPFEAVKTNVIGSENVVEAAIEEGVKKVIAVSTDKAVNPINLYGATKLCMEKLFIAANHVSAGRTKFSCVRYGNVIGSRGSVFPLFEQQLQEMNHVTITDEDMTRFWIELERVAEFVVHRLYWMEGGEIFIPEMKMAKVIDIARAMMDEDDGPPGIIGKRPGEKLDEILVTAEEVPFAKWQAAFDHHYIKITPGKEVNPMVNIGRPYHSRMDLMKMVDVYDMVQNWRGN